MSPHSWFRNATNGGRCGMAQSAMGRSMSAGKESLLGHRIFPRNSDQVSRCFGSACQVHQGLYIDHEAGHHDQNLLGICRA